MTFPAGVSQPPSSPTLTFAQWDRGQNSHVGRDAGLGGDSLLLRLMSPGKLPHADRPAEEMARSSADLSDNTSIVPQRDQPLTWPGSCIRPLSTKSGGRRIDTYSGYRFLFPCLRLLGQLCFAKVYQMPDRSSTPSPQHEAHTSQQKWCDNGLWLSPSIPGTDHITLKQLAGYKTGIFS